MSKITATITTSVDGYYVGPEDGPDRGLGIGGERLHYWVFGGSWTYDDQQNLGEATGEDKAFLEEAMAGLGAVICGRNTFEAAGRWGGENPWPVPVYVLTHEPPDPVPGFTFVTSLEDALDQAVSSAGDKVVNVMGGGDVIRQALATGRVQELVTSVAPVILGAGKRLFDGFEHDINLEPIGVRQSRLATHTSYHVLP